jgi:hypothetical protein
VRLGDDDDSADAKRVELMEDDVNDRGLCSLRGLDQRALHGLDVVDGVRIAIEQLEKQVSTQGVQSSRPPFINSVPSTARSPATLFSVAFRDEKFLAAARKLIHCMVPILRLQEKNAVREEFRRQRDALAAPRSPRSRRRATQFSLALVGSAPQSDT